MAAAALHPICCLYFFYIYPQFLAATGHFMPGLDLAYLLAALAAAFSLLVSARPAPPTARLNPAIL